MNNFFSKKIMTVSLATLLVFNISNVKAVDIITAPFVAPKNIFPLTKYTATGITVGFYCAGKALTKDFGLSMSCLTMGMVNLVLLPFAILDQKADTISVNEQDLVDLNYSPAEIEEYKNNLNEIKTILSERTFASAKEASDALNSLELGVVAKEQLRLK